MTRRAAVAGPALAALGLLLAGCAKEIDGAKGERLIRRTVTEQVGADVRGVRCPRNLKARAGGTFRCMVTGTDGTTGQVVVTMRDDQGRVSVDAPFLHVGEVETSIGRGLSQRLGGRVRVRCPEIVEVQAGGRFRCAARSGRDRAMVRVTQQDARGRVRYTVTALGG